MTRDRARIEVRRDMEFTLLRQPDRHRPDLLGKLIRFAVWIDDEYIRRIQSEERASDEISSVSGRRRLELWDFGVPLDSLDWSRLPRLRLCPSLAQRTTAAIQGIMRPIAAAGC